MTGMNEIAGPRAAEGRAGDRRVSWASRVRRQRESGKPEGSGAGEIRWADRHRREDRHGKGEHPSTTPIVQHAGFTHSVRLPCRSARAGVLLGGCVIDPDNLGESKDIHWPVVGVRPSILDAP